MSFKGFLLGYLAGAGTLIVGSYIAVRAKYPEDDEYRYPSEHKKASDAVARKLLNDVFGE